MGFTSAVKSFIVNSFNFKGRASRSEYWNTVLFILLTFIIVDYSDRRFLSETVEGELEQLFLLPVLWFLILMVPFISLTVRRLHDIGKTGWWGLFLLMPFVGVVVLGVFHLFPSERTPNRFGTPPQHVF